MSDADLLQEELLSLEAIYGDDFTWDNSSRVCEVVIPGSTSPVSCLLRFYVPEDYPSSQAPVAELQPSCEQLSSDVLLITLKQLEQDYLPGEVVLFQWIEAVKEQLQQLLEEHAELAEQHASTASGAASTAGASEAVEEAVPEVNEAEFTEKLHLGSNQRSTQAQQDGELLAAVSSRIISGEPYTVNKSTFQAHVAPVNSLEEVQAMVAVLLENKKIRAATHNIMAYRIQMQDKPGYYQQDYDDDGEAAAGGRLLHMLQAADVSGVAVVVSRWFGGVLLGPARFGLINNTARDLLTACGYIGQPGSQQHTSAKSTSSSSKPHGKASRGHK